MIPKIELRLLHAQTYIYPRTHEHIHKHTCIQKGGDLKKAKPWGGSNASEGSELQSKACLVPSIWTRRWKFDHGITVREKH